MKQSKSHNGVKQYSEYKTESEVMKEFVDNLLAIDIDSPNSPMPVRQWNKDCSGHIPNDVVLDKRDPLVQEHLSECKRIIASSRNWKP